MELGAGPGERLQEQVRSVEVHGLGDSKQYIAYDAAKNGWASVPPSTRTSTYQNPKYLAAANVKQPGLAPQPVPGIQYVGIPEFEDLGQQVSAQITAAIDGQESVATALLNAVRQAKPLTRLLLGVLTWIVVLIFFVPVLWMALTGLKTERDADTSTPHLIFKPTFAEYESVWKGAGGLNGLPPYSSTR